MQMIPLKVCLIDTLSKGEQLSFASIWKAPPGILFYYLLFKSCFHNMFCIYLQATEDQEYRTQLLLANTTVFSLGT